MDKILNALQSSDGSGKLSVTFMGVMTLLSPFFVNSLNYFGIITTSDNILSISHQILIILGSLVTAWGLIRKSYYIQPVSSPVVDTAPISTPMVTNTPILDNTVTVDNVIGD